MSLRIRVSEITAYFNQSNQTLTQQNVIFTEMMAAFQQFIHAPELTGAAWSSAKQYADHVHLPLLRGKIRANEAILADNQTFAARIAATIENEELDEEALERAIAQLERQKQAIFYRASLLENSPAFGTRNTAAISDISRETYEIKVLQDELNALRELDHSCRDLYKTADILLDQVSQGIDAISTGNCWQEETGTYSIAHLNLNWAKKLNKDWAIAREKSQVQKLMDEFGMEEKHAKRIVEFEKKFETYAKKMGWTTEEANFQFIRIMASMQYGYAKTGIINTAIWGISADVLNENDLNKLLAKMDYSDSQKEKLIVLMQDLYSYDDLKNDYIHVMGSLAAIMNDSNLSNIYHLGTTGFDFRSYFKEAATWSADIASNGLSVEDVRADLDAIAIAHRLMQNPSDNISQVMSKYYDDIANDRINRAEEFLKYYGNGNVEKGYDNFIKDLPKMLVNPANMLFIFKNDWKNFLQGDFSDTQKAIEKFLKMFNDELEKGSEY